MPVAATSGDGLEPDRQSAPPHQQSSPQPQRSPVDADTAQWLADLSATGARRDQAVGRLHALLVRIASAEVRRRGSHLHLAGAELDDLAHQAAADALLAVVDKLHQFRGESRFTTWAYRFVILEVSTKVARHFWRRPPVALDVEDWDRLPDRFGLDPSEHAQWSELASAVRRAVDTRLTPRQRSVFVAIVLNGVPVDALALELGTQRNAIYKVMFDARRKLRADLAANGFLPGTSESVDPSPSRRARSGA